MSTYVVMNTESGAEIRFETEEAQVLESRDTGAAQRAAATLRQSLALVGEIAEDVAEAMRSLQRPPDDVTLSLGVTIGSDAGIVVASAYAEAAFKFELTWRRK